MPRKEQVKASTPKNLLAGAAGLVRRLSLTLLGQPGPPGAAGTKGRSAKEKAKDAQKEQKQANGQRMTLGRRLTLWARKPLRRMRSKGPVAKALSALIDPGSPPEAKPSSSSSSPAPSKKQAAKKAAPSTPPPKKNAYASPAAKKSPAASPAPKKAAASSPSNKRPAPGQMTPPQGKERDPHAMLQRYHQQCSQLAPAPGAAGARVDRLLAGLFTQGPAASKPKAETKAAAKAKAKAQAQSASPAPTSKSRAPKAAAKPAAQKPAKRISILPDGKRISLARLRPPGAPSIRVRGKHRVSRVAARAAAVMDRSTQATKQAVSSLTSSAVQEAKARKAAAARAARSGSPPEFERFPEDRPSSELFGPPVLIQQPQLPPKVEDDNYELSDREGSDNEIATFDRSSKHVPSWSVAYKQTVLQQAEVNPDLIFGTKIHECDLNSIFPDHLYVETMEERPQLKHRSRRSSFFSGRDALRPEEMQSYARKMGHRQHPKLDLGVTRGGS